MGALSGGLREGRSAVALLGLWLGSGPLVAQDAATPPDDGAGVRLRASIDVRAHLRWSEDDRFPLAAPLPPEFVPLGEPDIALQTVAPGSSLELGRATVFLDAELPHEIAARVKLDFVDLYDRNPTSTDKKLDVDEAWISFGRRPLSLRPIAGTSFYALVGKAPKFERQLERRLEYAYHDIAARRAIRHDEFLATLRLRF